MKMGVPGRVWEEPEPRTAPSENARGGVGRTWAGGRPGDRRGPIGLGRGNGSTRSPHSAIRGLEQEDMVGPVPTPDLCLFSVHFHRSSAISVIGPGNTAVNRKRSLPLWRFHLVEGGQGMINVILLATVSRGKLRANRTGWGKAHGWEF